tara:strand:- start:425 stop:664 length:240 start_codon:yes stop_codon:yes gene_type:complete
VVVDQVVLLVAAKLTVELLVVLGHMFLRFYTLIRETLHQEVHIILSVLVDLVSVVVAVAVMVEEVVEGTVIHLMFRVQD